MNLRQITVKKIYLLYMLLSLQPVLSADEEKVVNLYNWSDYIGLTTITDFEKEYGIKVNYDIYDTTNIVDAKLLAGRTGYDVIIHSAAFSARLITAGIYQPLDRSKLDNWKHLDTDIMHTMTGYDPGNRYAVPYMWGTTGVSYNIDMLRERMPDVDLSSSDFFFEPEIISRFADCGVVALDGAIDTLPSAMIHLGYPANSIDPQHLTEAEELMKAIRPYIKYFSSAKMLIDMPNKEVCAVMSWSGDYSVAKARAQEAGIDINIGYSMPSNGIHAWFDGIFIPSDAPHPDNAHLLINFLMRPEVIAPISNLTGYANANRSATPLVDTSVTSDPGIYPSQDMLKKLEVTRVYGPKVERPRSRTWTRIKSGL